MDQNPQDPQPQAQPVAPPVTSVTPAAPAVTPPPAPPPTAPAQPAASPRRRFNPVRVFFGALGPVLVIGGPVGFMLYSLYVYQPTDRLACSDSAVVQQIDIAVHAVRQWAGREGQDYTGCPTVL